MAALAPDEELPPGTRVGVYEIVRRIGAGGMGVVYEATHTRLGGRAALKLLSAAVLAQDPDARRRFGREGQAAVRIRHPHVLRIFDDGTYQAGPGAPERPYLVMEYLEGESLSALYGREAPLPPERLVDLLLPVLSGVAAAHDQRVIHRDLKPENVFLDQTEGPKVVDFGIAKVVGAGGPRTRAGLIFGTLEYLAPELSNGARFASPQSDQYALGVLRLPVGPLLIEVRAPGHGSQARTVILRPGELSRETVLLPTAAPPRPGAGRKLAGFVLAGAAGLAALTGVVGLSLRERFVGEYNDDGLCLDELGNTRDHACGGKLQAAGAAQIAGITGLAVGAGLAAVSAGLLVSGYRAERRQVALLPFAGPRSAGLLFSMELSP
jgi:hypothetical protein